MDNMRFRTTRLESSNKTVVGVDTAKRVFQLHWVEPSGELIDLELSRKKFLEHFASCAPCRIGMEACGGSQDWAVWYRAVVRSRLVPMVKVTKRVWKHREEILNASVLGISNALSESINSKVQWLKRLACGFRNRERFRMLIYFHLGGLDLYPRPDFHM